MINPNKDSKTRSATDPFINGQREQIDEETYTESKGVVPPDI